MGNSRLALQHPADPSTSGQNNPSSAPTCNICGKSKFVVVDVDSLSVNEESLKPYMFVVQHCAGGKLYVCSHCVIAENDETARAFARTYAFPPVSPLPSDAALAKAERDYYLARLLFASRELSLTRFTRSATVLPGGALAMMCLDCRRIQQTDRRLDHDVACPTGHVLSLLDALMNVPPIPNFERRLNTRKIASEPAPAAVTPRTAAYAFSEPWTLNDDHEIVNAGGDELLNALEFLLCEPDDREYAERMIACVNACAGVPNSLLPATGGFQELLFAAIEGGKQ